MSDEIENQNVARVTFAGDRWRAAIGPDDLGLVAEGASADEALFLLACVVMSEGWLFDPSWRPRASAGRLPFLYRVEAWVTKRRNRRRAKAPR